MGRPSSSSSSKKMRNFVGILKDKASLIKATLLLSNKSTSAFHVAVLRATTHFPADPPAITTVDDVLALGRRRGASTVVDSLLRRLRRTQNAYVALKCLLTLHHILARGSPVLKGQISAAIGPHNNLLNLSDFRDESGADTWELSGWVRWYAGALEQGLSFFYYLSPLTGQNGNPNFRISSSANLCREISSLVGMIEQICKSPESLHLQRINLVHEVMILVGEDYRILMREIMPRISELRNRIEDLNDEQLSDFWVGLKKLEDSKEKLVLMFLNKKMKDGGWDLIAQMRKDVEAAKQRRESVRVVQFQGTGSTRPSSGAEIRPLGGTRAKRWLDVPWNPLVVSQAC